MEFSIRDEHSQSGQAIVEYLLVLVVSVSIILGGVYQLNSAFKAWANSYFGNYLACLLESGELPSISGTGGDSGVCNQLYEPFSLANGRPLIPKSDSSTQTGVSASKHGQAGERERGPAGTRVSSSGSGLGFGSRRSSGSGGFGSGKTFGANKKSDSAYTGSTSPSNYGGGYSSLNRRLDTSVRHRVSDRFSLKNGTDREARRKAAPSVSKPEERAAGRGPRLRVNGQALKKAVKDGADSNLTLPNFLRYILMAAILIALIMFLGGQALQISKSMEK